VCPERVEVKERKPSQNSIRKFKRCHLRFEYTLLFYNMHYHLWGLHTNCWIGRKYTFVQKDVKICRNLPTIDNLKPIGKHNTTPKRKLTNIFKVPSPTSI
jgi:hypothetical protein